MEQQSTETVETLTLPSGRTLGWSIYGNLEAANDLAAIFYFHGLPGSRIEGRLWPTSVLQKHNARLIAVDRPGMGQSTHYPARRVLDWPDDILTIADHLKLDRFYIMGVSGGAPYALACAKEIPRVKADGTGRLRGVAVISGMYPTSFGLAGMMLSFRAILGISAWLPSWATYYLIDWTIGAVSRDPDPAVLDRALEQAMAGRQEKERLLFADPHIHQTILDASRESFRQGSEGNTLEMALLSDWGFDVAGVDGTGVSLWHGKDDINIPVRMAEKAAQLMPNSKAAFYDGETHLSVAVNYCEAILTGLLSS